MDLYLGFLFCSINLCFCLCASTILSWRLSLCSIAWSQEGWFLQFYSSFSRLIWLFKVFCNICKSEKKIYKFSMAPHSNTLAWKIPWTEEPGRLQSMGLLRVRQDWATSLSLFTFHFSLSFIGEGNGNPHQCSCLENPRDGGAWWAAVYGVA